MSKSFFLYMHDDLSGDPKYVKFGKSMTPYSAVRARQKFCSKKFSLSHLWFGDPNDIDSLEKLIKSEFNHLTPKYQKGISATEVFQLNKDQLIAKINYYSKRYNLNVWKQNLKEPYSASKSSECPFGIPTEHDSYAFLMKKLKNYPNFIPKKKVSARAKFEELFDYNDN